LYPQPPPLGRGGALLGGYGLYFVRSISINLYKAFCRPRMLISSHLVLCLCLGITIWLWAFFGDIFVLWNSTNDNVPVL